MNIFASLKSFNLLLIPGKFHPDLKIGVHNRSHDSPVLVKCQLIKGCRHTSGTASILLFRIRSIRCIRYCIIFVFILAICRTMLRTQTAIYTFSLIDDRSKMSRFFIFFQRYRILRTHCTTRAATITFFIFTNFLHIFYQTFCDAQIIAMRFAKTLLKILIMHFFFHLPYCNLYCFHPPNLSLW